MEDVKNYNKPLSEIEILELHGRRPLWLVGEKDEQIGFNGYAYIYMKPGVTSKYYVHIYPLQYQEKSRFIDIHNCNYKWFAYLNKPEESAK